TLVLRTRWGGPWRRFTSPVRLITAHDVDQVRAALTAVDREVAQGGYAAGFVAYEAAAAFDLPCRESSGGLPLVCFGIFPPANVESLTRLPRGGEARLGHWTPSVDRAGYLEAVRRIKTRIEAGDTYQINYTFRLSADFAGDPRTLMRDLHAAQGGEWNAYLETPAYAICSASPELFFALDGRRIECRPMKGTAPRGFWPDQDLFRAEALRTSEKNRAENVMIVDMVRNDVGRVATVGSVRAFPMFEVERYPLQWQMTSTVSGDVPSRSIVRIFDAMFPSGSVTGAPKHSAMSIIRELETTPRGAYTGAIGYVSPHGRSHFNVAIRTVVADLERHVAEFGVGSGVVWDSVDRDEYEECLVKAQMLRPSSPHRKHVPSYVVDDPPRFRLLETLLWMPGSGFALLDRHIDRLSASAACFGFSFDAEEVRSMLANAVEDLAGPARVRIQLEADGDLLCEAVDLVPLPSPMTVTLAREPVDRFDLFLYHKTTKRDVYDRARAHRPEAHAVILWNEDGEITEATDFNVVVDLDGRRVTPPIACGVLPGTFRAQLLETGEIVEGVVSKEDLLRARRIQLINSVRGTVDVRLI
ncbi:MAG TPA: aminodeoxychorismate synthase component I, partial [Thermoanaerobaculia bacterium]|nr:aminodeoxychorismate synthase component I [Thermoanaerobaculia bacterium]